MKLSVQALVVSLAISGASASLSRHSSFSRRQSGASSEADQAKILDPSQECQTSQALVDKSQFPDASSIAKIVSSDKNARSVWNDIKNSGIIPENVKPKADSSNGQHMGTDAQQSNYNAQKDPDCWWTASKCIKPKAKNIPDDFSTCPQKDTWGLTFDDGPNCSHNAFYNFLQQKKLKATMFYIGANIMNHPQQAQRGIVDGHDICVHTWSHHYTTTLSDEQVFAELYYTMKIIKATMGVTPTCWRPPFGDVDDRVRAIATGLGLRTVLWQEDTDDWKLQEGISKDKIIQNYAKIIKKAGDESPIVLTHEIVNQTMQMFMDQYPKVSKAYKHLVPISACENVQNPYVEQDFKYPGFNDFLNHKEPQGLPSSDNIKVDKSGNSLKITPLSKQSGGFGNPGKDDSSSQDDSSNKDDSNSKGDSSSKDDSSSSGNAVDDKKDSNNNSDNAATSLSSVNTLVTVLVSAILAVIVGFI